MKTKDQGPFRRFLGYLHVLRLLKEALFSAAAPSSTELRHCLELANLDSLSSISIIYYQSKTSSA